MEKIILADGSEREVPTSEEMAAFTKLAEDNKTTAQRLKEVEEAKAKLENDPVGKNWRELREKTERLENALKAQGKEVKEDGTVVEKVPTITNEEIEAKAKSAAMSVILEQQKQSYLDKYTDPEQKKVVEHYFNKLSQGETLDAQNIGKFFSEAERLATPQSNNNFTPSFNGAPPRPSISADKKPSFADTDAGKAIADEIFGNTSFTKTK